MNNQEEPSLLVIFLNYNCIKIIKYVNNKFKESVNVKLGLALSGGGIRGIAHAGVLKALDENNIKVDVIGGTSSGALIASLYAMGYSPYYIYMLFKRYSKDIININIGNILSCKRNNTSGLNSNEDII